MFRAKFNHLEKLKMLFKVTISRLIPLMVLATFALRPYQILYYHQLALILHHPPCGAGADLNIVRSVDAGRLIWHHPPCRAGAD